MSASMDEVYDRMTAFAKSLENFQELLQSSLNEMQARHDAVDPMWEHDQFRRQYEARWEPLQNLLADFLQRKAPGYRNFLADKLRAIDAYLNG